MDPNANIEEQRRIRERRALGKPLPEDRDRMRELRRALKDWLAAGGFDPRKKQ